MRNPLKTYFPDRRRQPEEFVNPVIVIGSLIGLLLAVFGLLALVG